MMTQIKPLAIAILLADALLLGVSLYMGEKWLINTQIAFFSSLFVTISSFLSYKRVVQKRLESGAFEERDEIEKIEDRFDLYSEAKSASTTDNLSTNEIKEIIKEEKAKQTGLKKSGENLIKSAGGLFNPLRVISYVILVLGFLYLVNNHYLKIVPYLLGFLAVPFGALISTIFYRP